MTQEPWCEHCHVPQSEHAEGVKCLFQPTEFEAVLCARCKKFIPSDEGSCWRVGENGTETYHINCS